MVRLVRAIRVLLIVLAVPLALFVIAHVSGRVLINDHRLAHAIATNARDPSDSARQELADATTAGHRRRALQVAAAAFVFLCLFGGVVYSTRVIRAQTI